MKPEPQETTATGPLDLDWPPPAVPRAVVLAALSQALDLTEGEPPGHALRTAWIAQALARALALDGKTRGQLLWVTLLKDAGCSANAHPVAEGFGTDDRRAKRDLKRVDWARPGEAVRYAVAHARPGARWYARAAQVARLARRGRRFATDLVMLRCTRGAEVVRELGWLDEIPDGVLYLDEHWDGSGEPYGLQGHTIPLLARLAGLAQTVEIFWREGGAETALTVARARRGTWFDPDLVDCLTTEATPQFWARLQDVVEPTEIADWAPAEATADQLGTADYLAIARVFAGIVDAKSPWTQRHSRRTADIADAVAQVLAWPTPAREAVGLAALWHDLGKLGVSNLILDKPGSLTEAERAAVRQHPLWTFRILSPLQSLRPVAEAAAAHHERIDGHGYHQGLAGIMIPVMGRVVAGADVYEALTAERPYKRGWDPDQALALMRQEAGSHVDTAVVDALEDAVRRGLIDRNPTEGSTMDAAVSAHATRPTRQ